MVDSVPDDQLIAWLEALTAATDRPWVTLAYAQSLDGSLAAPGGARLALSGPDSLRMTHRLRAWHDAILVGIGTVLADNPRLTVRQVPGRNPRPVILDSQLRLPLEARLLHTGQSPLIFARQDAPPERAANLRAAGAEIIPLPPRPTGGLDLGRLLSEIHRRGLHRLMVEGGSRVLQSMLGERLGNGLIVTIAPRLVAGPGVLTSAAEAGMRWPELVEPHWMQAGNDVILWARLEGPLA